MACRNKAWRSDRQSRCKKTRPSSSRKQNSFAPAHAARGLYPEDWLPTRTRQIWRQSMTVALPYWRFDPPALRGAQQDMHVPVRQKRTTA